MSSSSTVVVIERHLHFHSEACTENIAALDLCLHLGEAEQNPVEYKEGRLDTHIHYKKRQGVWYVTVQVVSIGGHSQWLQ